LSTDLCDREALKAAAPTTESNDMRLRCRFRRGDKGFTVIEAVVAVTLLALALVLSIQPVVVALHQITDARRMSVGEHLAQTELEAIRAMDYADVGNPGYTPSGVVPESKDVTVEGDAYHIEIVISYAGSLTGLDIIDQGGDGVPGAWDPGVDYKVVEVTVTWQGQREPLLVQTIVAPPAIGALEGIANARVTVAAHEPFATSTLQLPELQVRSAPAAPIRSRTRTAEQVFPAINPGNYVVELAVADGWVLHPADIAAGLDRIVLSAGSLTETGLRVYRPANLNVTVTDQETGLPITGARISLLHNPSGQQTDYPAGQYTITGLVPDAYDIGVSSAGYMAFSALSVNIPADYPNPDHYLTVELVPQPVQQRTVTFTVNDNTGRLLNGATVSVPHPTSGLLTVTTGANGQASLALEEGTVFTATASTVWGHGPASAAFDPATTTSVTLNLTRPSGRGTMGLLGGQRAEFRYRQGTGAWVYMPVNASGQASFVALPGSWQVAKRCVANGAILGATTVTVVSGSNRTATISGTCP
jgi:type II secretory pathway pseudopilin PulG